MSFKVYDFIVKYNNNSSNNKFNLYSTISRNSIALYTEL